HIAPIISPAGGLSHHAWSDLGDEVVPTVQAGTRHEGAPVKAVGVDAIRKIHAILRTVHEVGVEAGGNVGIRNAVVSLTHNVLIAGPAEVGRGEFGIDALSEVVNAPVNAINIKMAEAGMPREAVHGAEGVLAPGISSPGAADALVGIPMNPRVVIICPQHEAV